MSVPVISIAQMRDWEKATWASGQTEAEVIRRVGQAVAGAAQRLTRQDELILILVGKGHNGEDARCARDHLSDRRVDMLEIKQPRVDASKLLALLSRKPSLIIDGLFGIGINRPLSPDWVEFIEQLNSAEVPVLAVDVPSGLHADTGEPQGAAVKASVTCTVGAPKVGLLKQPAWPFVGRLEVLTEVGLSPSPITSEIQWSLPSDFAGYPPPRAAATHKGSYGHLGILAGSLGYHGAAVLAAGGAQRAQPGLMTLFTPETIYQVAASQLRAVMVTPWNQETEVPGRCTAMLIGPGLAAMDLPDAIKALTRDSWLHSVLPIVVDASALAWLPAGPVPEKAVRVLTPHPGEAARLLGSSDVQSDRPNALRDISKKFGDAWVVLKGHQTLIGRSTGDIFVNCSGNPHLAQGGSGDVLSGFLAGLVTQPVLQKDPLTTIRYAVWQHGAVADQLQARRPGWIVEDLVNELGLGYPL